MRIIEIMLGPDGSCRIETKGYAGTDCVQASKSIEAALGRRTGEQLTTDYYAAETTQAQEVRQ